MLMRYLLQLAVVGQAAALPFDSTYGQNKTSLPTEIIYPWSVQAASPGEVNAGGLHEAKNAVHWLRRAEESPPTNSSDPYNGTYVYSPLVTRQQKNPDRYSITLKKTSSVSPWDHATWATNLQKNSTTNPNGYEGVPPNVAVIWAPIGDSRIYWATMGDETVKQLRRDPAVASVNAVDYYGTNMTVMEASSPSNEYMVIMDPRLRVDIWTHAKNVTERLIFANRSKDGKLFEGATAFYDDRAKIYDGLFDPETIKKIRADENVEMANQNSGPEWLDMEFNP